MENARRPDPSDDRSDPDTDTDVDEPVREVAETVAEHNPDPITRRESFEEELMDEGRSEAGEAIDLDEDLPDEDRPDARQSRP